MRGDQKSPLLLTMQIAEQIANWSKEALPPEVFLVEVEQKNAGAKLMVFIDSDEGLTIEQCRQLNKHLSLKLDEADFGDKAYTLEVSSPGVDRPLKLARQYPKHLGRELKVILTTKTELLGKLTEVNESGFSLQLKDKKKAYAAKEPVFKTIEFAEVESAVVQISFN